MRRAERVRLYLGLELLVRSRRRYISWSTYFDDTCCEVMHPVRAGITPRSGSSMHHTATDSVTNPNSSRVFCPSSAWSDLCLKLDKSRVNVLFALGSPGP